VIKIAGRELCRSQSVQFGLCASFSGVVVKRLAADPGVRSSIPARSNVFFLLLHTLGPCGLYVGGFYFAEFKTTSAHRLFAVEVSRI
jgi:hypothetical protein